MNTKVRSNQRVAKFYQNNIFFSLLQLLFYRVGESGLTARGHVALISACERLHKSRKSLSVVLVSVITT